MVGSNLKDQQLQQIVDKSQFSQLLSSCVEFERKIHEEETGN